MVTKAAPAKATKSSGPASTKPKAPEAKSATPPPVKSSSKSEHPAAEGIPLPSDPSAVHLQEEQDELQQPGRVSKAVANQIDNDPGYSKDQLAHMQEYWSHGDAVGEEVTSEEGSGD